MKNYEEEMIKLLFKTNAIRICQPDNPFWYTSGTIGPYYINTHFLYGSEGKANKLLASIDELKNEKLECPQKLYELVEENYSNDDDYKKVIDLLVGYLKDMVNLEKIEYISGGERRDWFFSLIVAKLLNKPHITIYKDLTCFITKGGKTYEINDIEGSKVLHIADLLNEGSSYVRAWVPAIKNINGTISDSLVVVDRNQGGEKLVNAQNVRMLAVVNIDKNVFKKAKQFNLIDEEQYDIIKKYIEDPKEAMRNFMLKNPEFLEQALKSDNKTKERAKLCIEKNIYNL